MIIFPAIDIKDGAVVRLAQGDFNKVTVYSNDPLKIARLWQSKGARWIHVVDLDGAKTGEIKNLSLILKIAHSIDIPIQMGGGVRTKEDMEKLLNGGVSRVVLGTKAIDDRVFLKDILSQWSDQIAISLDCSDGFLTQRGWIEKTNIKAVDFIKELESLGLKCLIYTDIARDGMLSGPNFSALYELLQNTRIPTIASGGVSSLEDIRRLKELEPLGLAGVITGKAIYEGKLDFIGALKIAS